MIRRIDQQEEEEEEEEKSGARRGLVSESSSFFFVVFFFLLRTFGHAPSPELWPRALSLIPSLSLSSRRVAAAHVTSPAGSLR